MSATKRTFIFLTVAVILTSSLTACQQNTQPAGSDPATNNSITIVIPEDPPSFNPVITDTGYDSLVMELTMLGLTDIDQNGNVFTEIAAELPTTENGGVVQDETTGAMTVTWKMREDVQWADGTPVTADDVIFTYNAILDHVNMANRRSNSRSSVESPVGNRPARSVRSWSNSRS